MSTAAPSGTVHVEHVMGTAVSFQVVPAASTAPERLAELLDRACEVLHRADAVFSTWNPRSPLSELRCGKRSLEESPPEVAEVLALCTSSRTASAGWFDPWAMRGGVDPTGLVKGWAVARAAEALRVPEVAAALVNGGGDVTGFGAPSPGERWRVGIRHPWRVDALACVVLLDGAVATSGTYERGTHLVDPKTSRPSTRSISATVCGPSLAMADALATALAVGADDALAALDALPGYEGYLIRPDGTEACTAGMRFAA